MSGLLEPLSMGVAVISAGVLVTVVLVLVLLLPVTSAAVVLLPSHRWGILVGNLPHGGTIQNCFVLFR